MNKKPLFLKNKTKIKINLILILILIVLISFYSHGEASTVNQKIESENQRLKKISSKIETVKREIDNLEEKENGYLASLHKIEQLLADTRKELQEIEKDLKFTENDLKNTEEEYVDLKADLKKRMLYLESRLREIYKHNRTDYLAILFNSKNFSDFLNRYKFIKDILSIDAKIINDIREKSQHLKEKEISLENRKEVLCLLKKEVEKEKENIAYTIKAKESIINKIDSQKEVHLKSLEELKHSSEEIKNIIVKMHQEELESRNKDKDKNKNEDKDKIIDTLKAKKGILALPIQGKIISNFGRQKNTDFNTYTFNSGIDISAPMGEVIRAAGAGEVIYTGCIKGYGQIIIINHGGRISTLYAHLFKTIIKNGDKVKKSQIIGQVGDSGGVSLPRLHFEVRSEGKPTDPMNWL